MAEERRDTLPIGKKNRYGELDPNAFNPVNSHPQFTGDYPQPRARSSSVPPLPRSIPAMKESPGINRPPKPPGTMLGPFIHYITTDLKKMLWLGSVLIFRHVSFDQCSSQLSMGDSL